MRTGISIRSIALAFALPLLAAGCGAEPTPPAPLEPACAPRSASDSARLNIDSSAEKFGVTPPCQSVLEFSIARNTDLRALEGTVRIRNADGQAVEEAPVSVSLRGPEGGMFRGEFPLAPLAGQSCRQSMLTLEIERCADVSGDSVGCPDVRVRPSQVLLRLEASGDGVPVCYED